MTLGPVEIVLIAASAVALSLLGYWLWMTIAGWLADRRWRKHGLDRRSGLPGRRHDD